MGYQFEEKEAELFRRIDEVLFYLWDPIGVSTDISPRDEYRSYLPKVFNLANSEGAEQELSDYLYSVETSDIGVRGSRQRCDEIASLVTKPARTYRES